MAKIIYSNEALSNLQVIEAYYLSERGSDVAFKVIDTILDRIDSLLINFPESGGPTASESLNRRGYRKLVLEAHVVIYSYDIDSGEIFIAHIYRESQNY